MNDDDVVDEMREALSDVRMHRPVELIVKRGRARRRHRTLLGTAVGGLAGAAALALAVPAITGSGNGNGQSSAQAGAPATAEPLPSLTQTAFTLVRQGDGAVKLTLDPDQLLEPSALEKALKQAGVEATVRTGAFCEPKKGELPQAADVFGVGARPGDSGESREYDLVIDAAEMPADSQVYISVFPVTPGDGYAKTAQYLVARDAAMSCRSMP
ncbi:hypothetical protein KIH74_13120 [Kineosporia sp. J2-2]|uniref:Uncharacterized protein n=1 Tax=Kineosporia corallincola TaxID=2835133 RepID=A0ABS5TI51_9ACTN|nr:hypothetical protein [Kineosporia corallincola]MBT0769871.1 hypothetical protein [Kineosporia corallincola]